MSKQKRFAKQFEIEAEIIKQKRKMKLAITKAEELEAAKKEQFKTASNPKLTGNEREFYMANGRELQVSANKLRRRAFMIENKKLPALKEALGEIKTKPLKGFLGTDEGVVLHE